MIIRCNKKIYGESDFRFAVNQITSLLIESNIEKKNVIVNISDEIDLLSAISSVWTTGLSVLILNKKVPNYYADKICKKYQNQMFVIDDNFVLKAFEKKTSLNFEPVLTGNLLIETYDSKTVRLNTIESERMNDIFDFLNNNLKINSDLIYLNNMDMFWLGFFALINNGELVINSKEYKENSSLIISSLIIDEEYERIADAKISSVLTFGTEIYSANSRNYLKEHNIRIYNIYDYMFTMITSGTDNTGIPIKNLKISVLNSSGNVQSYGMRGLAYINNKNGEKVPTGYECISFPNGKYRLFPYMNKAFYNGKYLSENLIDEFLKNKFEFENSNYEIQDNQLYIYTESTIALSDINNAIKENLPEEYSSVIIIKSKSESTAKKTYTSKDVEKVSMILYKNGFDDIKIDSPLDKEYTLTLKTDESKFEAINNILEKIEFLKNYIIEDDKTGAKKEHSFFVNNEIADIVISTFRNILENDDFGFYDNFFDYGGNSIMFIKLCFELESKTGKHINQNEFFANASPEFYCSLEETENNLFTDYGKESSKEFLINETKLDEFIPENGKALEEGIFLTGCTGFLGIFILAKLLEQTDCKIYCLVRSEDNKNAIERINKSLLQYKLDKYCDNSKIVAVTGNLSEYHLGLSDDMYNYLLWHTTKIIHCGAKVDFMYTYDMIKKTNVDSVREIIDMAAHGCKKEIHYISSIAVLEDSTYQGDADEDFDLSEYPPVIYGYNQSKWVADVLIHKAMKYGIKSNIYRVSTACGDSEHGIWQSNDLVRSVCVLCLKVGSTPKFNHILHIVPVDRLADLIVYCVKKGVIDTRNIYHLGGGKEISVETLVKWINEYNMDLSIKSGEEWIEDAAIYVESHKNEFKDNAVFGILNKGFGFDFGFGCNILTSKTDDYFKNEGINYSLVSQDEFNRCLQNMESEITK